jgi:hypothetical protein
MPLSVAGSAQGNQVCNCIATEPASGLQVMNFQIVGSAALLAAPTVSFQHLIAERRVFIRAQLNYGTLLPKTH